MDGPVGVHKAEIRQIVVEPIAIQAADAGCSPDMFGVAVAAVALQRLVLSAMIPDPSRAIGGDLRMAVETKRGLSLAAVGLVTLHAVKFDLRVSGDDGPGNHQSLEQSLRVHGL